ncbi:MAG: hypothetical protein ACKPKO_37485, partial [Candidatus Fonsibacter sp.]
MTDARVKETALANAKPQAIDDRSGEYQLLKTSTKTGKFATQQYMAIASRKNRFLNTGLVAMSKEVFRLSE